MHTCTPEHLPGVCLVFSNIKFLGDEIVYVFTMQTLGDVLATHLSTMGAYKYPSYVGSFYISKIINNHTFAPINMCFFYKYLLRS